MLPDERRLLAEMRRIRRDDREPSRIAGRDLILQAIVQAIARTDRAAFEQAFEGLDAPPELARLIQR